MDPETYIIEKACPEDVKWIARFQLALAFESENLCLDLAVVTQGVQHVFENPSQGFYIVARYNSQVPVGCLLVLKEWSDWRNAEVWWLHSVYVSPDHRRRGVFTKMFEYVETLARSSGARGLRLYVDKNNKQAQAVYSRLKMSKEHYELFEKMF
ncbi:MAG TPA: GNAT family N-acetyltransferase [Candidatus Limnocylindrales bacterium]|nr:GNAT family N-acetyltransferase [Candidatus Limnocylindrales bacterium]